MSPLLGLNKLVEFIVPNHNDRKRKAVKHGKAGQHYSCSVSRCIDAYNFAPQLDLPAVETMMSFSASVIKLAATKSSMRIAIQLTQAP
jgi:hypothetical protein